MEKMICPKCGTEVKKYWGTKGYYCPKCHPDIEEYFQKRLKKMAEGRRKRRTVNILNKIYEEEMKQ